jgi:hypothetical protein
MHAFSLRHISRSVSPLSQSFFASYPTCAGLSISTTKKPIKESFIRRAKKTLAPSLAWFTFARSPRACSGPGPMPRKRNHCSPAGEGMTAAITATRAYPSWARPHRRTLAPAPAPRPSLLRHRGAPVAGSRGAVLVAPSTSECRRASSPADTAPSKGPPAPLHRRPRDAEARTACKNRRPPVYLPTPVLLATSYHVERVRLLLAPLHRWAHHTKSTPPPA